ncbi:MAG: YceD family protein [Bacteroidota bacterium]
MKYDVEFKGLKEGLHEFEFEVQDTFFEHFEQGLVGKGDIQVGIRLEKRSSFMKLFFNLKGNVQLVCDRCLESYQQKIKSNYELFVKFGESEYEDDEIICILPEEHKINVAQLIYEYIILSLPLKQVHPDLKNGENGCNKEMLKKIEEHKQREEEKKEVDPRWAALKNWNNNQN